MSQYIYKSQIKEPTFEEQARANLLQALAVYQSFFKKDMTEVIRQIMADAPKEGVRV